MAKKKKPHGGKREGAGRPADNPEGATKNMGVTVPVALIEKLDRYREKKGWNRSQAVTEAIRKMLSGS